jgi:hypothetical protein
MNIIPTPFARIAQVEKFPYFSFPRIYNNFPNDVIKSINNKPEFNAKFKEYFLSMLNSNFTCNRLLGPHCHILA